MSPTSGRKAEAAVHFTWSLQIPMRDGIRLSANLYRPADPEPVPVIAGLTPYTADRVHAVAHYFARHGYAFAAVDMRGRGNSEGGRVPFQTWGVDGYDAVEWLAEQPWCNGAAAMWGGSAMGGVQWLTLRERPPHLRTIAPFASVGPGVDVPFFKNIFRPFEIQWLTLTGGKTLNRELMGDSAFWWPILRAFYLEQIPFSQLDRFVGHPSDIWQLWLDHPAPDDYWKQYQLSPEDYRQIDIPILTITGHYDDDQPGALNYYRQHMEWGSPEATARHYLVIGPWDHSGTRQPARELGGISFGEGSLLDMDELQREWYDWTLRDGPRPAFLEERVAVYVMGAEKWRFAESLESLSGQTRQLYLHSRGGYANDIFHSGSLEPAPPGKLKPDRFVYDPLDTRPALYEAEQVEVNLTDQRYALNLFGNGLAYHSAPFSEATEITGFVRFECWLTMDVPDTDLQVTVAEIMADGTHVLLTRDLLRARYRESLEEEKLVVPGEIERYRFDTFPFVSRQIGRGSRLRLLIQCVNSVHMQKNYNSGGVVAEESAADARVAHITLYHEPDHPSYLELPTAG